jgi:hypothetical protein
MTPQEADSLIGKPVRLFFSNGEQIVVTIASRKDRRLNTTDGAGFDRAYIVRWEQTE